VVATGFSRVDDSGRSRRVDQRPDAGDTEKAAHITTMNTNRSDHPGPRALRTAGNATHTHTPAEAALHAAHEHLAAVKHALVEAHEALDAIARELATAPAGFSPDALTTVQVATALGLGRATVAELIRRGEIASVKIGGARRVFRADLDGYIASLRAAS